MYYLGYHEVDLTVIKICGTVETILFRWKLRSDEIFSVAVPLLEITGRPGIIVLRFCILGSR